MSRTILDLTYDAFAGLAAKTRMAGQGQYPRKAYLVKDGKPTEGAKYVSSETFAGILNEEDLEFYLEALKELCKEGDSRQFPGGQLTLEGEDLVLKVHEMPKMKSLPPIPKA